MLITQVLAHNKAYANRNKLKLTVKTAV